MKYRDLDAGELFFFEDNFDCPKLKTENGHKDLRDNVTGSAPDDLSVISVYALTSERDRLAEALEEARVEIDAWCAFRPEDVDDGDRRVLKMIDDALDKAKG